VSARRVLFVADQFADASRSVGEHHPGGAELTDGAAIEACPWPIEVATSATLRPRDLRSFDIHVIANLEQGSAELFSELCRLGRHVLFEHDLRICQYNGNFPGAAEKVHRFTQRCICPFPHLADLYRTAIGTVFLTHRQLAYYHANPFFRPVASAVLGCSLMSRAFFERVARQGDDRPARTIDTAIVSSIQRIKGEEGARQYCQKEGIEPFVIENMTPEQVLETLAQCHTLVYLPTGLEPAGRLLVEARFLGCKVLSNPNAGVCGESWWGLPDGLALEVLRDAPDRFWRLVDRFAQVERHASVVPPSASRIARAKGRVDGFTRHLRTVESRLVPNAAMDLFSGPWRRRAASVSVVYEPTDPGSRDSKRSAS
jgi:hypothetical protein